MGCQLLGSLRKGCAHFFGECAQSMWKMVLAFYKLPGGQEWISPLHSDVFECEHFLSGENEKSIPSTHEAYTN